MLKLIITFLIITNLFSYTLKDYLLDFATKHRLVLIYNTKINPFVQFNTDNLYFNTNILTKSFPKLDIIVRGNYIIVCNAALRSFTFSVRSLSPSALRSFLLFLQKNNISYFLNADSLTISTTYYKYLVFIKPFLRKFALPFPQF